MWSVIHHRISEHQIDISLEVDDVRNAAVSYSGLDGFQVHWSLDDFAVVRCLGIPYWIVKDVTITMLHDLSMQHNDGLLKSLMSGAVVDDTPAAAT
jgi:hypothetical protein